MLCPSPNERCRMVHPHPCTPPYDGPCFARPQCEDVCFNHFCDTGKVCRPRSIECDDPPCYPVAECTGVCDLFCDRLERYSQSRRPHGSRPFHDLTGTVPSFHHSIPDAVNGGMAPGDHSYQWLCWERLVTKKLAALWIALLICRLLKWLSVFIFLSLSLFEESLSGFLSA